MQIPVQIVFDNVSHSDVLETHIRDKARKLDAFYPHLMRCHVSVEQPHRHKHQGKGFNVRITLQVPGSELIVNRKEDEDIYIALRDAFAAARRQLEDHRARGTRSDSVPQTGRNAVAE